MDNWSEYYPLKTTWEKLRIAGTPQVGDTTVAIDLTDLSYASSNGQTSNHHDLTSLEWGIGADCRSSSQTSPFRLNLEGTPFRVDTSTFLVEAAGYNAHGSASCDSNGKVCSGACGGDCGYCGFGHPGDIQTVTLLVHDQGLFNSGFVSKIFQLGSNSSSSTRFIN